MDSLSQIHEEYDLSAISEPNLDLETVEVPESGPMTFEFDLEVRPQFELPQWKGLQIEKPVREFTDVNVDQALKRILTDRGSLVPFDGPAEPDEFLDYLGGRKSQEVKLDLGFMRELGEIIKNTRLRVIFGVQEKLFDNPNFSFVSQTLNRVKDRFEQVIIRKEDTGICRIRKNIEKDT